MGDSVWICLQDACEFSRKPHVGSGWCSHEREYVPKASADADRILADAGHCGNFPAEPCNANPFPARCLCHQREDLRREVERLRGMLSEALDIIDSVRAQFQHGPTVSRPWFEAAVTPRLPHIRRALARAVKGD